MNYRGHVQNGVVIFEGTQKPPEGVAVEVVVSGAPNESLADMLLEFAGTIDGLPEDMAERHDQYIHGRRTP